MDQARGQESGQAGERQAEQDLRFSVNSIPGEGYKGGSKGEGLAADEEAHGQEVGGEETEELKVSLPSQLD